MQRYYTHTFLKFLFAFLGIIGVGFGIIVWVAPSDGLPGATASVDNTP